MRAEPNGRKSGGGCGHTKKTSEYNLPGGKGPTRDLREKVFTKKRGYA